MVYRMPLVSLETPVKRTVGDKPGIDSEGNLRQKSDGLATALNSRTAPWLKIFDLTMNRVRDLIDPLTDEVCGLRPRASLH